MGISTLPTKKTRRGGRGSRSGTRDKLIGFRLWDGLMMCQCYGPVWLHSEGVYKESGDFEASEVLIYRSRVFSEYVILRII